MNEVPDWRPHAVQPSLGGRVTTAELLEYLTSIELDELLVREKALVFRGFDIPLSDFEAIADVLLPNRLSYVHGNSPRKKVGRDIYTSTEYPSEYVISMHNEMSYASRWPSRLLFYCETAAANGGATPLVDGRAWLEAIASEVRAAFAGGVRYLQNLHAGYGFGKSWQATFETDDREAVEAFLDGAGSQWRWKPDGTLWIGTVGPATLRHPVTGTEVWFNQADQFHIAGLGEDAAILADLVPDDELPQSVTFADGSPIPAEYIRHVQEVGLQLAVDVEWRPGDLLLVDNVLVGHGRRPFTGPRRVLVAMSD